jgi:Hemerythrin HHE cation binding domain
MDYKLDMSLMLAMHDALRRELVQIARITARQDDNPAARLHAALGWELFKKFLVVHHSSEDDALWPALRARVAGHPDQLALADELEAEHAAIDPLLAAIDAAAADPDYGHQRFGDIVDELSGQLGKHLTHEENDGLPLIDATLSLEEWQHFGAVHAERSRPDAPLAVPWLLDGASPQTREAVLSAFPPPLREVVREQWEPTYAHLSLWDTAGQPAAGR